MWYSIHSNLHLEPFLVLRTASRNFLESQFGLCSLSLSINGPTAMESFCVYLELIKKFNYSINDGTFETER